MMFIIGCVTIGTIGITVLLLHNIELDDKIYYEQLYKSEFKLVPEFPPTPSYGFGMLYDSYFSNKTMC